LLSDGRCINGDEHHIQHSGKTAVLRANRGFNIFRTFQKQLYGMVIALYTITSIVSNHPFNIFLMRQIIDVGSIINHVSRR